MEQLYSQAIYPATNNILQYSLWFKGAEKAFVQRIVLF
jgi:hypothetical protein